MMDGSGTILILFSMILVLDAFITTDTPWSFYESNALSESHSGRSSERDRRIWYVVALCLNGQDRMYR